MHGMRQLLSSERLAGGDPTQPASRMSIANAIRDCGTVAKQHAKGDRGAQEMQGCEGTQTEAGFGLCLLTSLHLLRTLIPFGMLLRNRAAVTNLGVGMHL